MNSFSTLLASLPPGLAAALREVTRAGNALSIPTYLVGGAVRDLLLSRQVQDIDLAIEGSVDALLGRLEPDSYGRLVRHDRFGTVKLRGAGFELDIARSRSENYSRPGALPVVAPAPIETDLARRDFTISALALRLTEPGGEIIDSHGGRRDIDARLIRTLHDRSFQDDATRTLRAVRYSARLDFAIEDTTLANLKRDLGFVDTITGARLRREIDMGFSESRVVEMFEQCETLGVLRAISPYLGLEPAVGQAWRLALAGRQFGDRRTLGWCLIARCEVESEVRPLTRRLLLPAAVERALRDVVRLQDLAGRLVRPETGAGEVAELLSELASEAVWAQMIRGGPAKAACEEYLEKGLGVRPLLTGSDIIEAGAPEGPEVGRILKLLRRARVEERVHNRQEELDLVRLELNRKS